MIVKLRWILVLSVMFVAAACSSGGTYPLLEPDYTNKRPLDFSPFDEALASLTPERIGELDELVLEANIPELQQLFTDGRLTSEELVTYYIYRIREYDLNLLNSVIELNPDVLAAAREKDAERANGGALSNIHGIPVLLKDNIAAQGDMHWTAGAWALRDLQANRDAFIVQQLRESGAIILGKTNLSEWANWMDRDMPDGFSVLGGQTRHPYGPFNPLGSSSGSAVAVAANFTVVSIGTETSGSIISPATANSVVAIKTSRGLVSRDFIIPLAEAFDVPGPMGRSVTDVAILLNVIAGIDENDPVTEASSALAGTDFTQFLTTDGPETLRVGYFVADDAYRAALTERYAELLDDEEAIAEIVNTVMDEFAIPEDQIALLEAAGIEVVPISASLRPSVDVFLSTLLQPGFKYDLNAFLENLGEQAPVNSLESIIDGNAEDAANRAPFGQRDLIDSNNTEVSEEDYRQQAIDLRNIAQESINRALETNGVTAILGAGYPYPEAGFPAITIPVSYSDENEPQGIVLVGGFLSEPQLIQLGYRIEQSTQARLAPNLQQTIAGIREVIDK